MIWGKVEKGAVFGRSEAPTKNEQGCQNFAAESLEGRGDN